MGGGVQNHFCNHSCSYGCSSSRCSENVFCVNGSRVVGELYDQVC